MTHHTELARSGESRYDSIQALMPATMQTQADVDASASVCFCQVVDVTGAVPNASSGDRIALAPDTGHYLKVPPLGRAAVYAGSAGGAFLNAVQKGVTVIYIYYDSTAGKCYMTEMI